MLALKLFVKINGIQHFVKTIRRFGSGSACAIVRPVPYCFLRAIWPNLLLYGEASEGVSNNGFALNEFWQEMSISELS